MNKKRVCMASLFLAILMTGCTSPKASSSQEQTEAPEKNLVGNDKDDHGCIASAGYQWSELLKDCIRPFEKGVKCVSATDENATSAAYVVFSNDSSQVELFLPKSQSHPILTIQTDRKCWTSSEEDSTSVRFENGFYTILHKEQPIFVQQE